MPAAAITERQGTVEIDPRFNGPEASANGGYACGRLAAFVGEPAEVTLRMPPPLATELTVVRDGDDGVRLLHGEVLIAEGRPAPPPSAAPPVRPSFEQAIAARERHPCKGVRHPLSDCFVAVPFAVKTGDGLGMSPGPLAGQVDVGAAPFFPDASVANDGIVRPEIVWAALDCPSYVPSMWTSGSIALLGRLTAVRHRDVHVGERLAVVGWPRAAEGRKRFTSSALIDADGAVVAQADATWIELAR